MDIQIIENIKEKLIGVLILGLYYNAAIVAIFMLLIEIVFCYCLIIENRVENQHETRFP